MVDAGAPHGAVSVRHRARHKQVPLRPRRIAIHVDLAVQAVVDSEREDLRRAPEKISDRVPALEPTQPRAVPGRVLSEERGDPIRVIVVIQGRVP
jgi:hypothetical protein